MFERVTFLRRYPLVAIAAAGLGAGLTALFVARAPRAADAAFLAAIALAGTPLVFQTLRGMLQGKFAADLVAMLAILTAVALGHYFAGAVIVLMQSGGEALERFAMGRASRSLEALMARAPKRAARLTGAGIEEIAVEAVRIDDRLVVRPGDMVPVDGTVLRGSSHIDQSALTGEPMPLRAVPGTELMSGSVNLDGALELRALRPAETSQYQQILRLVERARLEKPPIQRLADRVAVWFTPVTLLMCGLAWLITHDPASVLSVLVVATPCPLILATPVAVIAGVSRAADRGIIVKTGAAIEQVGRVRVVVFDKTGTLTVGQPTVVAVRTTDGGSPDAVRRLAASLEQLSTHTLAKAVVSEARARDVPLAYPDGFEETPGLGVAGTVGGQPVAVGSAAFLASRGVSTSPGEATVTTSYVAVDGHLAGWIEFSDRLRPQVPALMQRLVALGIDDTVMLTGDRQASADAIALQAGIRTVRANLLAGDKVTCVEALRRRAGVVVMVGDGINDAPALAAATVGIAMGAHGTAASAEAADIVILVDDISRVADAIAIGRRMRRIALQGIGVGLGVSLALMAIASLGVITPALGAVLQEALDAGVILNALRAR